MNIKFIGKTLLIEERGKRILVIGDLHLGYEEALNESGVLVTRKLFEEMIVELDRIFAKIVNDKKIINNKPEDEAGGDNKVVDEIILLGDVKHNFGGNSRQEWNDVLKLMDYLSGKCERIVVIRGNHDNYLKTILSKRKNVKIVDYYIDNETAFVHGDKNCARIWDNKIGTIIAGHLHPAITLEERGGAKREKYKCFLEGTVRGTIKQRREKKKLIIVPSFSEYNKGTAVEELRGDEGNLAWKIELKKFNVKIVGDNLEVLDFGLIRDLT